MLVLSKALFDLTAADLMVRDVVRLPEQLSLREAAQLLLRHHISGAPVVDAQGRCVGLLSSADFLRLAEKRSEITRPGTPPLPIACSHQAPGHDAAGQEVTLCLLPPGACPVQKLEQGIGGVIHIICREPHGVLADWQVVQVEKLPADEVRNYMTPNPVTVPSTALIRDLARRMLDFHIHRLIVVNDRQWPVGVISTTDILAAVAYADPHAPGG